MRYTAVDNSNEGKKKKGLIWFLFFLVVLFVVSLYPIIDSGVTSVRSGIQDPKTFISGLFRGAGLRTDQQVRKIINNDLVQEESATIDVIDKVSPSVVSIVIKTVGFEPFTGPYSSEDGIGTGFIVDPKGIVVTNSHVVDNMRAEYFVLLSDGTTLEVTKISRDQVSDLAILEVSPREDLPAVELGDSDELRVGQTAIAIGNALGQYQNSVTKGVVSGIARELTASSGFGGRAKTYENVVQTDAALNPGNSGGPLLNISGQVIGINVATTRGADNISFSIPVNTLKPLLASYLAEGKIVRPYMGIEYSMVTADIARIQRIPVGAFITGVVLNSPAEKAGIERGDIIMEINGQKIDETTSISSVINKSKVGDTLDTVLDREGESITLRVTLEVAPDDF